MHNYRSIGTAIFIFLSFTSHVASQNFARVSTGIQDNINIWMPGNVLYDKSTNQHKRRSNTFSSYVLVTVYNHRNFGLKAGPSFKRIGYTIKERIVTYTQNTTTPGNPPSEASYDIPTDFKASSLNLGLMISLDYRIPVKRLMYTGLNFDGYCFEFYKAKFDAPSNVIAGEELVPKVFPPKDRFLWSNSTVSVFYLYSLVNKPSFSLSAKANLGMNVHSAWDQFSKYAFLGLGLEVGFGDIGIKDKGNLNK